MARCLSRRIGNALAIGLALAGCTAGAGGAKHVATVTKTALAPGLAALSDGTFADLMAVGIEASSRKLVTIAFVETGHEASGIEPMQRRVLDARVPAGAVPFAASAGFRMDPLRTFWCGWVEPASLSALSVYAKQPLGAPLEPTDRPAAPPLVMKNRTLRQYLWRRDGDSFRLTCVTFHAAPDDPPRVESVALGLRSTDPLLPTAGALPTETEPGAAFGWLESGRTGLTARFARERGSDLRIAASAPLAAWRPLPNQRAALWVGRSGGAMQRFVAAHVESGEYAVVSATWNATANTVAVAVDSLGIAPGGLASAASFFYRNAYEPGGFTLLLDRAGTLWMASTGPPRTIRSGVPADYDFPVLASIARAYEASVVEGGDVDLQPLP